MSSINQEVAKLINQHISIQKSLNRDIINLRGLAKFLIKRYHLTYPVDGVISAIRRYDLGHFAEEKYEEEKEIFSKMLLTSKDNVARIILKDSVFDKVCDDYLKDSLLKKNLRIIKAKEQVTLLVNQKNIEEKLSLFEKEDLISVNKGLSEVRLQFQKDITFVKGIVSRISAELATMDINVVDIIFSMPDILVYVKEEDMLQALDALRKIKV
jgi:aspartokinase